MGKYNDPEYWKNLAKGVKGEPIGGITLTLNSSITEEQWDAINDVDFEHTNEITFHTKHGKEVKFVKASMQPEIVHCKDCRFFYRQECTRSKVEYRKRTDFCSYAERRTADNE